MIDAFVQGAGGLFSPEAYVLWTRVQCTAWTAADLVIVFVLIRLGDLVRVASGRQPHRVSYLVLLLTVPLAVAIPFSARGLAIFALELMVTIPHFLIILYVIAADSRLALPYLARRLEE